MFLTKGHCIVSLFSCSEIHLCCSELICENRKSGVCLVKDTFKKLIAFFRDWDNQSRYLGWMIARTKPFVGPISLVFLLSVITTVTGIGGTVVSKYVIDGVTGSGPVFTVPGIAILVAIAFFGIAIGAVSNIISTHINERYAFGIRSKSFDTLLNGLWSKVSLYHSGDTLTRLTSDIDRVANGIANILPTFFLLLIRILIAFVVLFYYDHWLAIASLIIGPVGVLISLTFSSKLKKYQTELNAVESAYRSFLQETIENLAVAKTFSLETRSHDRLTAFRDERLRLIMKRNRLSTAMNLCISLIFTSGYFIAFGWSVYRLSTGSITYGTMTVFLSLVSQVQAPIMSLGSLIPQFITVLSSTGRIMELEAIPEDNRIVPVTDFPARIGLDIRGLSFAYGEEPILENIDLNIRPGDIVGVVGYSGSGKTTLIRLLLSLITTDRGDLKFYGENWEEPVSASSRRFISYVPQGNTLFSGTIADNLRIGKADADEVELWEALAIADAADFVRHLEDRLDTVIGENGLGLSEGQAQRIAIARAVIRNAPVMILDEATSALDAGTEEKVLSALSASGRIKTCVLITHRRSMLKFCTRAIRVDNREINEMDLAEER